ncbi:MAG: replication factor C small subunit, partial [Halolamina sp.]
MSEADAEDAEDTTQTGREIWIEKYRPQTLDDIHGQEETIERVKSYVEGGELPHMLFTGPA